MAKKMAEEGKIAVRNHSREANELLKELKNEKEISEDELFKRTGGGPEDHRRFHQED